ncbi:MAG: ABC transporter substrate-binding protein [Armatimonadetes bacterium]|nr:ABC transporter substrate-binding protein [Armatimonadota bacterium]
MLLVFLVWLAALGPGLSQEPEGRVTIEFWHALRGQRGRALELLVEDFNAAHPEIRVVPEFKGPVDRPFSNDYATLYRALLEGLASGKPPAVAQVYENWTTELIGVDALVPVESFPGADAAELRDFVPVFLEANRYAGRIWTLPFNKSIYVLFYNRKWLEQAGLTPPASWRELREASRKLTQRTGLPGLVFQPGVDVFGHYLYAHGGRFFDDRGVAFDGAVGAEDLQYWLDLVHADRTALPTLSALEVFANQGSGFLIETTSKIGRLEQEPRLDFGVVPLPEGSTRAYQIAGTNLAIFAAATPEQREAAWRFVRFLTSPAVTARWAKETGYLPVRTSAVESPDYAEFVRAHPHYAAGIQALPHAVVQPRLSGWESIRGILDDAMFAVLSRRDTPRNVLLQAAQFSRALLEDLRGDS